MTLLLVLGTAPAVHAQESVRPHLHAGMSRILPLEDAGPGFLGVGERSLRPGVTAGGGLTILGPGWLGVEADVLLERIHLVEDWYSDGRSHGWTEHTRASYLSLPIMALLQPLEDPTISPFLNAGPFLAVMLVESEEFTTSEGAESSRYGSEGPALSRATYGFLVGAGVSVEIGSYDVRADVRYARGMADSYIHRFRDVPVHTANLSVGLIF